MDRKDRAEAVKYFRMGTQLGDPDSMMSLAEMIGWGYATPINEGETRIALFERAAGLGNEAAGRALQIERENEAKAEQDFVRQQQQQEMTLRMFGAILQNIPHR